MYTSEGHISAKITEIIIAEPRFAKGPNDFDICLKCERESDPNQVDWWRGEVSDNYGTGNFATQKQKEITLANLRKIGFEGDDLTTLEDQLIGKVIPITVKAREYEGKTYYDIKYIGGGAATPKALAGGAMKAKMAAMFGGKADQSGTSSAPKTSLKAKSPF